MIKPNNFDSIAKQTIRLISRILDSVPLGYRIIRMRFNALHKTGYGYIFLLETRQNGLKLIYWCQDVPQIVVINAAWSLLQKYCTNYDLSENDMDILISRMEFFNENNLSYLLKQPEFALEK